MHCPLLDLSAELQLIIVEEMLRDEHIKVHTNDDRRHHKEMQDEPVEFYHLINWSCKCSHFRNFLAPNIWKSAKLANDEKSGFSINALAKSPHNVHVRSLQLSVAHRATEREKRGSIRVENLK